MKTTTFKDWTLTKLDKAFHLKQVFTHESELMQDWIRKGQKEEVSDFEKQTLLNLQVPLQMGSKSWNETELENKFISPVIMTAQLNDREIGYFLERPLSAIIGEYELSGIVDGMIAKGFREPEIPFFCMHEYKRSLENAGMPDAQALASMLVARQLNENSIPAYGLFVVGSIWNFMVLEESAYCISRSYNAEVEDVFEIFKLLKALRGIVKESLISSKR